MNCGIFILWNITHQWKWMICNKSDQSHNYVEQKNQTAKNAHHSIQFHKCQKGPNSYLIWWWKHICGKTIEKSKKMMTVKIEIVVTYRGGRRFWLRGSMESRKGRFIEFGKCSISWFGYWLQWCSLNNSLTVHFHLAYI